MHRCGGRVVQDRKGRVDSAGRSLARIPDMVEMAGQRFDIAASRLSAGLRRNVDAHDRDLARIASRLSPHLLERPQQVQRDRLHALSVRLQPAALRKLDRLGERLEAFEKLRVSLNPDRPLRLGFARVHRADGALVTSGAALSRGDEVSLVFQDKENVRKAVIDGAAPEPKLEVRPARPARPKPSKVSADQGELF